MRALWTAVAAGTVLLTACGDVADGAASSTTTAGPTTDGPTTAAPTTVTTAPATTAPPPTTSPSTTTTTAPTTTTIAVPTRPDDACVILDDADASGVWYVVNDGVMGGRSSATGALEDSVLTLTGEIVTAGGGFSSVRFAVEPGTMADTTRTVFRVRTDGRAYSVTADDAAEGRNRRVNHDAPIPAEGGDWEIVEVAHADLMPQVFGTPVDDAPFVAEAATEMGIILADGTDGPFELSIDWVAACP